MYKPSFLAAQKSPSWSGSRTQRSRCLTPRASTLAKQPNGRFRPHDFIPSIERTVTAANLNVFTVEEYESNGKTGKKWTGIGAAFPHKEGIGFSIELKAFPVDGRLVALPPDTDDSNSRNGKQALSPSGPSGAPFLFF